MALTIHRYFRELVRDLFEVEVPDLTISNIKLLINELNDSGDKKQSAGGKRKNSEESGQLKRAFLLLNQRET